MRLFKHRLLSIVAIAFCVQAISFVGYGQSQEPGEIIKELNATFKEINKKQKEIDEHFKEASILWTKGGVDPFTSISGREWAKKRNQLNAEFAQLMSKREEEYEALKRATAKYDQLLHQALKYRVVMILDQKQKKGDPIRLCRAIHTIERDTARILKWSHSEDMLGVEKTLADFVQVTEKVEQGIAAKRPPKAIFKDVEGLIEDPTLKGVIGEYSGFFGFYAELGPEVLAKLTPEEQLQEFFHHSGHIAHKLVWARRAYKAASVLYDIGDESGNPFESDQLKSLTSMVDFIKEIIPEPLAPIKAYLALNIAILESFDSNFQAIKFENAKKNLEALLQFSETPASEGGEVSLYKKAPFGEIADLPASYPYNWDKVPIEEIPGEYEGPTPGDTITLRIHNKKNKTLTLEGKHKDWTEGFFAKERGSGADPGRWIFWRYPKASELADRDPVTGEKVPDWVKESVTRKHPGEKHLDFHWLLTLKIERKTGRFLVLEGDWSPGTIKWTEKPVKKASFSDGYSGDPKAIHLSYKKLTCF